MDQRVGAVITRMGLVKGRALICVSVIDGGRGKKGEGTCQFRLGEEERHKRRIPKTHVQRAQGGKSLNQSHIQHESLLDPLHPFVIDWRPLVCPSQIGFPDQALAMGRNVLEKDLKLVI